MKKITYSKKIYELHAEVCRTLSSPKRLEILDMLRGKEMAVGALSRKLGIKKANLSQHLAILKQNRILISRRSGLNIYYKISNPKIIQAYDILREVLKGRIIQDGKLIKSVKKSIISITLLAAALLLSGNSVLAQGMMGFPSSSSDSAAIQSQQQEAKEGKNLLDGLNNRTVACSQLNDSDFEKIGEYFMGQSIGDTLRHIAMNEMMKRMMSEQGEEQMHIAMGKRLSGCDTSAAFPSQGIGFMPMMQMMMGGWSSPFGLNQANNSMMNFGYSPFGWFGWIFMILFWVFIVVGIIALIRWLIAQTRGGAEEKSALTILKERYAKGEIDKNEFEEKKKDLS